VAGKPIDELAVVISASLDQLQNDLGRARGMLKDFAKAAEQARPPSMMDGIGRAAATAARGVGMMATAARSAVGYVGQLATGIAGVARNVIEAETGLTSFSGVVQHLKEAVNLAADAEQTALSFEVMLGSAQQAQKMLAEARQYAASTPFSQANIINSAKQLTAYGVSAENVIPTVKMLGDVAAGVNKPIEELSYLYGTLYTQQRAYTRDINQFTSAGIEIIPALSKVMGRAQDEIKQLTEDGRVGRDEVTAAFNAMTQAGGRFYKMTERQGQTFKGRWEQMVDGFQLAKTKLGVVLIEELGLKEATQNAEGFAKTLEQGMDRIRPIVRGVGNVVRGMAQGAVDLGRAFASSDMGKALGDRLRPVLDAFNGVKVDPARFAHMAVDVIGPFYVGFEGLRDSIEDVGRWIDRNIGDPLKKASESFKGFQLLIGGDDAAARAKQLAGQSGVSLDERARAWEKYPGPKPGEDPFAFGRRVLELNDELDEVRKKSFHFPGGGPDPSHPHEVRKRVLQEERDQFYRPPTARESPESVRQRFQALELEIDRRMRGAGMAPEWGRLGEQADQVRKAAEGPDKWAEKRGSRQLDEAVIAYHQFQRALKVQSADEMRDMILRRGVVPPLNADFRPPGAPPAPPEPPPRTRREAAERDLKNLHDQIETARREREAAEATAKAAQELGAAAAAARDAYARGMGILGRPPDAKGVPLQGDLGADVTDLIRQVKREFGDVMDPMFGELGVYKVTLDKARKANRITDDQYALAWSRKVDDVARSRGAGQPYQLPQAAAVGTTEDARILTQWMTGQSTQTTENLLRQLVDISREELRIAKQKVGQGAGGGAMWGLVPATIGGP